MYHSSWNIETMLCKAVLRVSWSNLNRCKSFSWCGQLIAADNWLVKHCVWESVHLSTQEYWWFWKYVFYWHIHGLYRHWQTMLLKWQWIVCCAASVCMPRCWKKISANRHPRIANRDISLLVDCVFVYGTVTADNRRAARGVRQWTEQTVGCSIYRSSWTR